MSKVKPIVAKTPEELASNLGLSRAAAKEWQLQHLLLGGSWVGGIGPRIQ